MPDTIILGCRTLENELGKALTECSCDFPVRWIESGLHNVPQRLRQVLQENLDRCQGSRRVLMAMGYCGNAIAGLKTGDFQLVLPRVDDCISLLLGSCKERLKLTKDNGTYFLTEGWLKGEQNIWKEYQHTIQKYGEARGRRIFDVMLGHYRSLALLDTGCYSLEDAGEESRKIADTLGLQHQILPATLAYLKKLLNGPWPDEEFLTVPPNTEISNADLTLPL